MPLTFSMTQPPNSLTVGQLQDGDVFQLRGIGGEKMGKDVIFMVRAEDGEPEFVRLTAHRTLTVLCFLEPHWPVQRFKANLQLSKDE